MNDFTKIINIVKDDLQLVDNIILDHLSSDIPLINRISKYLIKAGGKKIRPLVLILSANALGKNIADRHLFATVIELIHTATLLHDDVVDKGEIRRNKKVANLIWGNAQSVLVGDFLYSRAFEIMVMPKNIKIIEILAKTTNTIAQGEVLQLINCYKSNISEKDYLNVIYKKTASLFEASALIGSTLANSNTKVNNAFSNYGLNLGHAFQIMDDLLDFKDNWQKIGKRVGKDIKEGKITLPIIYILKKATKEEAKMIKGIIKQCQSDKDYKPNMKEVVNIINKYNGFEYCFNMAKNYATKAKQNFDLLPNNIYIENLKLLADISYNRTK